MDGDGNRAVHYYYLPAGVVVQHRAENVSHYLLVRGETIVDVLLEV